MPLSIEAKHELDRPGVDNIKLKLQYAGAGVGSVVPGLLNGMVSRGDVETWLADRSHATEKMQADTLWWAKAAAWVAGIGIAVSVICALLGK